MRLPHLHMQINFKSPNLHRVANWPTSSPMGEHAVRRTIFDALKTWSDASALTFREKMAGTVDILISFESRSHGDGYPFDERGVILAHAFFPGPGLGGDVHFDDDEIWSEETVLNAYAKEVSLFSVALHEFGHSLGLSHSADDHALMFPYYRYKSDDLHLHYDDLVAIQTLYGRGNAPIPTIPPTLAPTSPPTSTAPTLETTTETVVYKADLPPDVCKSSIDAISTIRTEVFAFKGKWYWRYDFSGFLVEEPKLIKHFWYGLPQNVSKIDAVLELKDSTSIFFFIGNQYYEFNGNRMKEGYPKNLTELGLDHTVTHIDAAFHWEYNDYTYLFSADRFWRFYEDHKVVDTIQYPRAASSWQGIPLPIDSAITLHFRQNRHRHRHNKNQEGVQSHHLTRTHDEGDTQRSTYFFKGTSVYRFDGWRFSVDEGYPQEIEDLWAHCRQKKVSQAALTNGGLREVQVGFWILFVMVPWVFSYGIVL